MVFDAALTQIKEGAFAKCGNLHTVNIPEGVTAIENNTFNGCQNLNTVKLPSTLTTIGDGPYAGATSDGQADIEGDISRGISVPQRPIASVGVGGVGTGGEEEGEKESEVFTGHGSW